MLNANDSRNLKSQLSFENDKEHMDRMHLLVEEQEYNLFKLLNPRIFVDGNMWCVMIGDDPMNGIQGFGKTPYLAVLDFNKSWHRKLGQEPKKK